MKPSNYQLRYIITKTDSGSIVDCVDTLEEVTKAVRREGLRGHVEVHDRSTGFSPVDPTLYDVSLPTENT